MKKIFLILLLNFSFCFSYILNSNLKEFNGFNASLQFKDSNTFYSVVLRFNGVKAFPYDDIPLSSGYLFTDVYKYEFKDFCSGSMLLSDKSESSFDSVLNNYLTYKKYFHIVHTTPGDGSCNNIKNQKDITNKFDPVVYFDSATLTKEPYQARYITGATAYFFDIATKLKYFYKTDNFTCQYPLYFSLDTEKCEGDCSIVTNQVSRFNCMCDKQGLGNFVSFHNLRKSTHSNSKDCIKEVNGKIIDNCTMTITDATYNSKDGKVYKSGEFDCAIECSKASFGVPATSDYNSICFNDTTIIKKDDNSTATVGDDSGNGGNNNNKPDNPNPSNPDTPNTPGNNNGKDKNGTTNNKGDININNNQDITGDTNSTTINNNNNVNNNGGNGKDGDSKIYDLLNNFDFKGNFENGKNSFDKDNEESIKKIDEMREKGNSFLDDSKSNFDEAKKSVNDLINSVKNPINSVKSHGSCKTCLYSKTFEFYRGYSTHIEFDFCEFICRINTATYLFFYGVLTFLFIKLFFNIILRLF